MFKFLSALRVRYITGYFGTECIINITAPREIRTIIRKDSFTLMWLVIFYQHPLKTWRHTWETLICEMWTRMDMFGYNESISL